MKKVPAYVCEKCGYWQLGEENAPKVQAHERMPAKGACNSLDGLIVIMYCEEKYMVVRQAPLLSIKHEALYLWDMYSRPSLKPEKSGLPKEITSSLQRIDLDRGFTADYIVGSVLWTGKSENTYENYEELSKTEFQRVAAKLKQMYPKLYAHAEFKRKLNYRRPHSKK